jgi:CubicO group peptidase (beta-lactamase class C family)/surface polysaccharide O-acyltransferase-like enzyme
MVTAVSAEDARARPTTTAQPREIFLDAVRVIALIRVVLWHALGLPVLTYFVAAVPTMFFVTGSLLAKSFRRGARVVVVDRARRILVPLWVFTLGAYLTMAIAHLLDGTATTKVPWSDIPFWLFPINDPHGSAWEGGYMSSPLWYLRALLWLILLSPLLLWMIKRTRGFALAVPLGAVFVLEWLAQRQTFTGTLAWRVGDLALYATFVTLGFVHRQGWLDPLTRRHWAAIGAAAALCATWWCLNEPVPDNVVNDSHPAHLFVGLAWLSAFFVARPWIERAATFAPVHAFIGGVSQRTITIYLWHSTAVIVSFELLRRASITFPPGGWVAALLIWTAGITTIFVLAFGWVEDLANRRSPRVWASTRAEPRRGFRAVPMIALNLVAIGAFVLFGAADATVFNGRRAEAASEPAAGAAAATQPKAVTLRVPSQAPKAPVFAPTTTTPISSPTTIDATPGASTPPPTTTVAAGPRSFDDATLKTLTDTIAGWLVTNKAPGIEVAIYQPGFNDWSYATGTDPATNANVDTNTRFDIESITKTFTATLVWQAIDRGEIDPDKPIGALKAVPQFTYTQLTPRQLMAHRTGLLNYRDTPEYLANPGSIDTPQKALAATSRQPLKFTPGTQSDYSSSNFLVLGFLLEQVTGRSYDSLVNDLIAQSGIGPMPHLGPAPGAPNFSTAGLTPTATQLAHWGVALLHDNTPELSATAQSAMRTIDATSSLGEGLTGYCPCTQNIDGSPNFSAFGQTGGYTWMEYVPADKYTLVVNVALHNRGCSWGLKPPASSSDRAM